MGPQGPVVAPLDGSELAESAVPVAAELARRAGAPLRLVHVHVPVTSDPIHVDGLPVIDEHFNSLRRDHERAYLERASRRLVPDGSAATALLDGGAVAPALRSYAQSQGAVLIVMATHGRGGLERAWLGSVADETARTSPVPLLLIRPEPGAAPTPPRRILVALDGSALAESILEHVVRFARMVTEAEAILLEVVQPVGDLLVPAAVTPAEDAADRQRQRLSALEAVARRLEASGLRARPRVEVARQVVPTILAVARDERADVIALATHGRSGLVRYALGSVADKLVRASHTPVLLFRPPDGG